MKVLRMTQVALLGAGLFAWACGGDTPEEEGAGGNDTKKEENMSTSSSDSSSSSGDTSSSGSGAGTCDTSIINQDDPCEMCTINNCAAESLACCQKEGCLDVVFCAQEKGCGGIDCYTPDKCMDEIDAAGLDVATSFAQALGDCAIANCSEECSLDFGGAGGGDGF